MSLPTTAMLRHRRIGILPPPAPAPSPAPSPSPSDTFSRKIGMLDGTVSGNETRLMFINWFNNQFNAWGNIYHDALGGIAALPVGQTMFVNLLYLGPSTDFMFIKPGTYVLKWAQPGGQGDLSAVVTGPGVSGSTSAGSKRVTCTIAQVTPGFSPWNVSVTFTNSTGGPCDAPSTSLVFCHTDHEHAWDLGERWNPDYVTFCGGAKSPGSGIMSYYRSVKGSGVENSQVTTDTTAILTENNLFWGYTSEVVNNHPVTTGIPYSMNAKLCAKLDCDYLAGIPLGASDAVMRVIGDQIASVTEFTGNVFCEVGNENWGTYHSPEYGVHGFSANQWLNYYAGAHSLPVISSGAAEAEAHVAMRAAAAIKAAYVAVGKDPAKVKLTISFQTGQGWGVAGAALSNPGAAGYADFAMQLVDAGNIMGQGNTKRFYELCDQVLCAAYSTPNTGEGIGGPSPDAFDIYYGRIQRVDWKTTTDAQMDTWYDYGTTETIVWMNNALTYLNALRPALATTFACYEMGQQYVGGHGNQDSGLRYTIDVANNKAVWSGVAGIPDANPSDGDQMRPQIDFPEITPPAGDAQLYYWRRVDGTSARLYYTFADATAPYVDDAHAKAASVLLDQTRTTYYGFINLTRCVESFDRFRLYLDSAAGRAFWQRMMAAYVGTGKFRCFAVSINLCSYDNRAQFAVIPGMKSSLYTADTPRYTWFIGQ